MCQFTSLLTEHFDSDYLLSANQKFKRRFGKKFHRLKHTSAANLVGVTKIAGVPSSRR